MNLRQDARIVGVLAALLSGFLLFPIALGSARGEPVLGFAIGMAAGLALGSLGLLLGRGAETAVGTRDDLAEQATRFVQLAVAMTGIGHLQEAAVHLGAAVVRCDQIREAGLQAQVVAFGQVV